MNVNRRVFEVVAALVVSFGLGYWVFSGGHTSAEASLGPTDLVVGQAYEVADFLTCSAPDGSRRKEWHFGGVDRSRRNQLTPDFDGRGRRIFKVVTTDRSLPASHMRLRLVSEADPTLEGFLYGSYAWEGLVVEYNGHVESQSHLKACGPAR